MNKKYIVLVLVMLSLFSVRPVTASSDARYVFFGRIVFHDESQRSTVEKLLFPENFKWGHIDTNQRMRLLNIVREMDIDMITFAQRHDLSYDRDWLLFYLPDEKEIITANDYVKLLYYASFMPSGYRGIIEQPGYEVACLFDTRLDC